MAFYAKPQGRGLTGSIGNQGRVQITIFSLEKFGLKSGEGAADPQVQLLPGVHGLGLVLVGLPQVVHGQLDVFVGDRRKFRPENSDLLNFFILDFRNGQKFVLVTKNSLQFAY